MAAMVRTTAPEPLSETQKQLRQLGCGAVAGVVTKSSVAPLERIKILFQIQGMRAHTEGTATQSKYGRSITGAARIIHQEGGLLAFYKGNGANCFRVVPVYALKFCFNDTFRDRLRRPDQHTVADLDLWQLALAGSAAGFLQNTITYPLEVVRTRLSLCEAFGHHYTGIADCVRQTIAKEGIAGMYKGIVPTWASGTPYVGLQMTFFEMFRRLTPKREDNTSSTLCKLLQGSLAGLSAQTITFPGDTIRRRMQTNGINGEARLYSSTMDCCKKTFQHEGVVGFFRGWAPNAIRAIPGAAIQFACYETLKETFVTRPSVGMA